VGHCKAQPSAKGCRKLDVTRAQITSGHFQHGSKPLRLGGARPALWLTNNLFHARMSRPDASHQAIGRIYNLVKTQASTAYLDTLILAIICFYILPPMILV
jgi:hypothetical protein